MKGGDEVAEKDIAEKTLEGYNDVFADIANVLLFNGRRLINPDDLEDRTPNSSYKVDGKIHGQERDVPMHAKRNHPSGMHWNRKPDKSG